MSSTVPPGAETEDAFEADTWDIPDPGAEIDKPGKPQRAPLPAASPARVQPPPLPVQRGNPASGAPRAPGATAGAAGPKPTEPTARAAEPAPSSKFGQPPPLPRQRPPSSAGMPAVQAPGVPRPPSEPRAAGEPRPPQAQSPSKEWARLAPSTDLRRPSGERGAPKAPEPADPGSGARRSAQQAAGAAANVARSALGARSSSASKPTTTERPKGMAVPPPASLGSPEPSMPVSRAMPQARTLLMPSVKVEPEVSPPGGGEDAWDIDPDSTQVVAVPPSRPDAAAQEAAARVAAPASEAMGAPSAKAAPSPAAKAADAPSSATARQAKAVEATKAPEVAEAAKVVEAAKVEAAKVAEAPKPPEAIQAKAPPESVARAVEAPTTPPGPEPRGGEAAPPAPPAPKVIEAAPPAPPAPTARVFDAPIAPPAPAAWVLETPTARPAPPALTVPAPTVQPAREPRAVEAPKTVEPPQADAGWLAPILEPGASLDEIERREAAVLFDFDSDLLPGASEQHRNLPGQSGESICTFWLGADCFGLDVQLVNEVLLIDDILPLPWAPPALLGLFNSRGRIVPVVDLATLLGLPASPEPRGVAQASPAILIKADSLVAAALIDRPGLVVQVERGALTPTDDGSSEPWVKGHLRPDERSHPAVTLLDPECLVQRFLDMSRFPDIRTCLGSAGYRPARAPSTKNSGGEIS